MIVGSTPGGIVIESESGYTTTGILGVPSDVSATSKGPTQTIPC